MSENSIKRKPVLNLKSGKIIECRGAIWRVLREQDGFYELELIKQDGNFAETPVRVWALPELERDSIRLIEEDDCLHPAPESSQIQDGKLFRPTLAAHRARTIHIDERAKDATTAMSCAIDHKAWQFEPWRRIVDVLPFPRLLIADDVGLGKTTEAAIILAELARRRRADRVMIIAPQHLCEKWQDELYNRFGLAFEVFTRATRERLADRGVANPWEVVERVIVSRDFVKRWENFKPLSQVTWDMVVIDECHHFVRDDSGFSTRLRDFAEKIALKSPGLLLLSATPFTGSKDEFKSLISLLDPKFSGSGSHWKSTSEFMVRRLKKHVKNDGEEFPERKLETIRISSDDLSKSEEECFRAVHEVLTLQTQNTSGAESWRHLQVETLRKRLSSSWPAFYSTCSEGEIAKWFDTKVAQKIQKLIDRQDFSKFRKISDSLKKIHKTDASKKIVIFTEAIASQRALAKFLTTESGYASEQVALIEGQTDRDSRLQMEQDFANPNSKLKILIATDTISEGKDLQHACHHLIHFELPWSLVKIEQRNGRIDRLGQRNRPEIMNVVLDLEYTPDQRILDRLSSKMAQAQESLGSVSAIIESEQLRFGDLEALDEGGSREINLKKLKNLQEELGLELGGDTPLAPVPMSHRDDSRERRTFFDLMITKLGGGLTPNGKNSNEELLWLPDDRWTLPELIVDGFGYPTQSKPWRVTFSGEYFLAYEKFLLSGGITREPLQFLSPIHPVVQFTESRFRFLSQRKGYPIFSVRGAPERHTLVTELTIKSPSGRIITQSLEFLSLTTLEPVDPSSFGDLDLGGRDASLPKSTAWSKVGDGLRSRLAVFEREIKKSFESKRKQLLHEHERLDPEIPGLTERRQWIDELWTVESSLSTYQILGLIVSEARS